MVRVNFHLSGFIFIFQLLGNYSRLATEFEFKRSTGYYIPQVYTPCTMIVILSWISFWLNRGSANVRLTICAISLLIMTFGCQSIGSQIPKTSYVKSIDVFTGVCMTFVFIAFIGKLISFITFCFNSDIFISL